MDGYFVDFSDLDRAATAVAGIGRAIGRQDGTLGYAVHNNAVGHPELAAALAEFDNGSRHAIAALSAAMQETATRLQNTAATYLDVEATIRASLGGNGGDAPGAAAT